MAQQFCTTPSSPLLLLPPFSPPAPGDKSWFMFMTHVCYCPARGKILRDSRLCNHIKWAGWAELWHTRRTRPGHAILQLKIAVVFTKEAEICFLLFHISSSNAKPLLVQMCICFKIYLSCFLPHVKYSHKNAFTLHYCIYITYNNFLAALVKAPAV